MIKAIKGFFKVRNIVIFCGILFTVMLTACSLASLENDTDKDTISTSGNKVSNESKNNTENTEKTGESKGTDESSLKEKCHAYYYELFEDYTKPFLNIEGEMFYGMYGEKGALIWRWKDASFTEEGRYEMAFAIDTETYDYFDEVRYEGKKISKKELKNLLKKNGWDGIAYSGYQTFKDFEPTELKNCGSDIFGVSRYFLFNSLNLGQLKETSPSTPTPVYVTPTPKPGVPTNTPTPTPTPSGNRYFVKNGGSFDRITDFTDGYAWFIDGRNARFENDKKIVKALYLYFDDLEADGYLGESTHAKAIYSIDYAEHVDKKSYYGIEFDKVPLGNEHNNMMFIENSFWDLSNYRTISLYDLGLGEVYVKQGIYVPMFENEVCELITMKNDKYWVMHIDKTGKLLDEPMEIKENEITQYANSKTYVYRQYVW